MAQCEGPSVLRRLLLRVSQIGRMRTILLASGTVVILASLAISWSAGSSVGRAILIRHGEGAALEDADDSGATWDDGDGEPARAADSPKADSDDLAADVVSDDGTVIIDVDGAVITPGVYELPDGSRVQDAIDAAGGLATDADVARVNRAERLIDGAKLLIPRVGEQAADLTAEGQIGVSGSSTGAMGTGLVNINQAGADELDALPGIGPATAEKIVSDREQNGPFLAIEDLMRVSGIGEKKFEELQGLICV